MKYLYISTRPTEFCTPEANKIDDFVFNATRIYCTKMDHRKTEFQFILKQYNFNCLMAHVKQSEIVQFIAWKTYYCPSIPSYINIYDIRDIGETLYQLGSDINLNTKTTFFRRFEPVLAMVTRMTNQVTV
mgnify:CR=1 FL=1